MTDPKPIPQDLLKDVRAVEAAMESAAQLNAETLQILGDKQQELIQKLCDSENLDRKRVQVTLLVDRGEYVVMKEYPEWQQVAGELTKDIDRQEHSNLVALCFAFSLFAENNIEMPDAARDLLLKMTENLDPQVRERVKGYLYS